MEKIHYMFEKAVENPEIFVYGMVFVIVSWTIVAILDILIGIGFEKVYECKRHLLYSYVEEYVSKLNDRSSEELNCMRFVIVNELMRTMGYHFCENKFVRKKGFLSKLFRK